MPSTTSPFALAAATPPAWAAALVADLDHLLLEQAHLEKKAAASALGILFRWPDQPALQVPLARLAREELVHFERVVQWMAERDVPFGSQRPGAYARRLKEVVRRPDRERLLDELLVGALIEARSGERMTLVAAALQGEHPQVAACYRELVLAEERHVDVYGALALEIFGPVEVTARWQELAAHEAEVMARTSHGPGLHSGWGGLS